jgi:hypothetical protein
MGMTNTDTVTDYTDDELLAAMRRSVALGDAIEVTDEWLAQQRAELDAPTVMVETVDDTWTHRRYYVDERLVVTIRHGDNRVFRCSPDHRREWRGVTEIPVGEHLDGCGWHDLAPTWDVYLAGYGGSPRYCRTPEAAYAEADRMAESARRCRQPVAARLCRLYARHDGPCLPWS